MKSLPLFSVPVLPEVLVVVCQDRIRIMLQLEHAFLAYCSPEDFQVYNRCSVIVVAYCHRFLLSLSPDCFGPKPAL